MRFKRFSLALASLLILPISGCGSSSAPNSQPTSYADVTGNWYIPSIGFPPVGYPSIAAIGALRSSGAQVTGTLRLSSATGSACGSLSPAFAVSGTIDSAENLTLTSQPFDGDSVLSVQLNLLDKINGYANGTVSITGTSCSLPKMTGAGLLVPPLNGTFSGTVVPAVNIPPSAPGSGGAILSVSQAATPDALGQFPLSGSLQFTAGTCTTTIPLVGSINGAPFTLTQAPGQSTYVVVSGDQPPNGNVLGTGISFPSGPCNIGGSAVYSGALIHQ